LSNTRRGISFLLITDPWEISLKVVKGKTKADLTVKVAEERIEKGQNIFRE